MVEEVLPQSCMVEEVLGVISWEVRLPSGHFYFSEFLAISGELVAIS